MNNFAELEEFYRQTGLPVALDESFSMQILESPPKGVSAFIIKPGISGGVIYTTRVAGKAESLGIKVIISSAFLSAVGLLKAAQLAAVFTSSDDAMGLDTSKWLARDFIASPIQTKEGRLDLVELQENLLISDNLLSEIDE